jgi:2-polyprenyl-3-methyl-5-hydroxy-6-metoxy-1,4-benzoquinol methylase
MVKFMGNEDQIINSYNLNASEWSSLIRNDLSENRKTITNPAIIRSVLSLSPSRIIDLGCGEGWLVRELCKIGIDAVGVEGSNLLVESARNLHEEKRYINATYKDIATSTYLKKNDFDMAVANFSLIGEESTIEAVDACSKFLLKQGGYLIVQTLHPCFSVPAEQYCSGWRQGTWSGLPGNFSDPAPWYFRTLEDWVRLFSNNALCLYKIIEPRASAEEKPVSIILIGKKIG